MNTTDDGREPFALAGEHPVDPVAEAAASWRASMDPAVEAVAEWRRLSKLEARREDFPGDVHAFIDADNRLLEQAGQFWVDVVRKVKPTTLAGAIELLRLISGNDDCCHPDVMGNAISALAEMGGAGVTAR